MKIDPISDRDMELFDHDDLFGELDLESSFEDIEQELLFGGKCPNRPIGVRLPGITCENHPDIRPPNVVFACFDPFKTDLKAAHRRQLDALVETISRSFTRGRPFSRIRIVGHGAKWPPGSKDTRISISKARANRVRNELVKRLTAVGIDRRQLEVTTTGVGCLQPRAPNDSPANRRLNLRVVVELKRRPVAPPVGPPHFPVSPTVPSRRLITGPKVKKSCVQGLSKGKQILRTNRIRINWSKAIFRLGRAKARVNRLADMSPRSRRLEWNRKRSRERIWFGLYSDRGFGKVKQTLQRIHQKLISPKFTIACSKSCPNCSIARSSRRLDQFFLCDLWFNPTDPLLCDENISEETGKREQIQTFIHEVAHLVGISRTMLSEKYGVNDVQRLARRNPLGAIRNADNYAYYVMSFV